MAAKKITEKDDIIWALLADPRYRVTADGKLLTRAHPRGGRGLGPWRRAGWVSPSRGGAKVYRRVQYLGVDLYEHRIVHAARKGTLCPFQTINHRDLDGTNNRPSNLELVTASENTKHAQAFYRRTGMSPTEARANWIKGKQLGINWRGTNATRKFSKQ